MGKKTTEKATIIRVGYFNEDGKPVDWKFDRIVRFTKCRDGVIRGGGYTADELRKIKTDAAERAVGAGEVDTGEVETAPEAPEATSATEPDPEPESAGQELDPIVVGEPDFVFIADVTGITVKKPSTGPRVKEIKITTSDLAELREFDEFMGTTVEITVTARHRTRPPASETTGKNEDDDAGVDEAPEEPGLPDTQDASDEKHGSEDEDKTKSVCTKCGADLDENPDDPAQLVCTDPDCGEVHVNPAATDVDFD